MPAQAAAPSGTEATTAPIDGQPDLTPATNPDGQIPAPPGTRTSRILGALRVNYVYQAVVLIAGLWLTPFLVTQLGETEYGLWIAGTQIVAWLTVMDLGVVALVPREVALITGAALVTGDTSQLPRLIDRTLMLLLWQLPLVAIVTLIVWVTLPSEYALLAGPLLLVFAAFVAGFPFRLFQAVLTGAQDLVFVAVQTSIGWTLGFVVTVGLVTMGFGLYSLAFSFVAVQVYQFAAFGARLVTRHRHALPRRLTPLAWVEARRLLLSGTWFSVAQVAQVLVFGTDVVIITQILGAEAVVPYAITAKLVSVLANQPVSVIQSAFPAISEIRGTADMGRLRTVAGAVGQAMLILSAVVFCVVLIVNQAFVDWWGVPNNPYAGDLLTGLLLIGMIARHANFAAVLTLFSLGGEKQIALTTLTDGFVTVLASILLVRSLGVVGAPLGTLAGVLLVSLPSNLMALARRSGIPVSHWVSPLGGWAWRFLLLALGAALVARQSIPATFVALAVSTVLITVVVFAVMIPVALRPPLATYLVPRLSRFRPRWST